ncbi:MAG: glycosyltransferase [Actinomycetes bacterium]
MRILIISYFFQPDPEIGAVRPVRAAQYLISQGHDVRVLSAAETSSETGRSDYIDDSLVLRTPWFDVSSLRIRGRGRRRSSRGQSLAPSVDHQASTAKATGKLRQRLTGLHNRIAMHANVGWVPFAIPAGRKEVRSWQPDVIFATGPPFFVYFIGTALSKASGAPWIADFRDMWTTSTYYRYAGLRERLVAGIEIWSCKSASMLTTVSEPLAQDLRQLHGLPVGVVLNGFDDFPRRDLALREPLSEARVNILYVGNNLYGGRHDPTLLFEAAHTMGLSRSDIRFHFLGTDPEAIVPLAQAAGVEDLVEMRSGVSREQSLDMQTRADALLLLLWNDPSSEGVYSGKLFEYVGARRPVLYVGYAAGVAAELILERNLGYVVDDGASAQDSLGKLLSTKVDCGLLPDLSPEGLEVLSRDSQNRLLEGLLDDVRRGSVHDGRGPAVAPAPVDEYQPAR